ncbi:Peptidyl-prolyl cis-trans isomerase B (PPIase B) (Cyclophilin B) (Rotamase B) [Durusdinium trenchii]|uniref:Peptidyl-prolyl cis-trans isomerase B (PPIase B) (Cyclophilin B) (Rotamase B) n=1 Tax=Durusdinium trenchii TaxID=1381693 RepID=A0ABP0J2Q1_9DINO
MIAKPSVVILDEPTTGLDPVRIPDRRRLLGPRVGSCAIGSAAMLSWKAGLIGDIQAYGGYPEPPARIFEGTEEIDLEKKDKRPSGSSEKGTYFWKMTQDKRFIEVVVPVDDWVEAKDVIYRVGEEPEDPRRGPTLQLGYRVKGEDGKFEENLLIDGQVLNAITREESFWILDDMVGVKVIILTLSRPRMRRQRHDPILRRKTEEERIEPQTWDALLVEDRDTPDVTHKVFMDIELEGKPAGRMEFGLFGAALPKTVENFRGLCNGCFGKTVVSSCSLVALDASTRFDTFSKESIPMQKDEQNLLCPLENQLHKPLGLNERTSQESGFLLQASELQQLWLSADELEDYNEFFKVKLGWALRWGGSLGLGEDVFGTQRVEGQAGRCDSELKEVVDILGNLVETKGEGAKLYFYKPEWEKGRSAKAHLLRIAAKLQLAKELESLKQQPEMSRPAAKKKLQKSTRQAEALRQETVMELRLEEAEHLASYLAGDPEEWCRGSSGLGSLVQALKHEWGQGYMLSVDCEKSQDRFPFDADVCSFGVWIAYCDEVEAQEFITSLLDPEDQMPVKSQRDGQKTYKFSKDEEALGHLIISIARGKVSEADEEEEKLCDDPALQGCCNFPLDQEQVQIGSCEGNCDIVLMGVGITSEMCSVHCEKGEALKEEGGSTVRVLLNGKMLQPDEPEKMKHGDCLILGYSHAFRLVEPTPERVKQAGSSEYLQVARSTVPKLDVSSAFEEAVCVEGKQLEVFGNAELHLEIHTLTDVLDFQNDAPEIVICCLEKPSPLSRFQQTVNTVQQCLRDPNAPTSSQDLADKRWMLGKAKHPLAHAMGLDEHMSIRGHGHLLSIFSLEDFLPGKPVKPAKALKQCDPIWFERLRFGRCRFQRLSITDKDKQSPTPRTGQTTNIFEVLGENRNALRCFMVDNSPIPSLGSYLKALLTDTSSADILLAVMEPGEGGIDQCHEDSKT